MIESVTSLCLVPFTLLPISVDTNSCMSAATHNQTRVILRTLSAPKILTFPPESPCTKLTPNIYFCQYLTFSRSVWYSCHTGRGGAEVQLYLFFSSALGAVWSSSRPGNSPRYLLRRLGVPQRPSGRFGRGINRLPMPEIKLRISGSQPSHSKYRLRSLQLKAAEF